MFRLRFFYNGSEIWYHLSNFAGKVDFEFQNIENFLNPTLFFLIFTRFVLNMSYCLVKQGQFLPSVNKYEIYK